MEDPKLHDLVRWPTPDEVVEHVRKGRPVKDAFDFGRPTSPFEFGAPQFDIIPIDAKDSQFLEARQYQQDQITRELGIPPALLHDAPDNPRRVYRGMDMASARDFTGFVLLGPDYSRVLATLRITTEGFEQFIAACGSASRAISAAGEAWARFGWAVMTKAQRRRAGKRLIREEIGRRRMEKTRAD